MHIIMSGLNHNTAPIEVREKLAITSTGAIEAMSVLGAQADIVGCVVLSTCNRTEIYAASSEPDSRLIAEYLSQHYQINMDSLMPLLYHKKDEELIRHLFSVSAGLDSMVLGEAQILGQVRDACQVAMDCKATDSILNTLFRQAIVVGKRVRSETEIGKGAVSVSHAAVELAKDIYGDLSGHTALIIGAGEMSEIAARLLISSGVKSILVSNRTYERAHQLAVEIGGGAIKFDEFSEALHRADIVISSTGSPHAIINRETIKQAMKHRKYKRLLLIDIAVPRDIEENVGDLDDVFLYNIDDLQMVVEKNRTERAREIEKVHKIIDEELVEFMRWLAAQSASPTIAELQLRLEHIRRSELDRFEKSLSKLSDKDREAVEQLTKSLLKKVLKEPIQHLKDSTRNGSGYVTLEVARKIFGLDDEETMDIENKT